MNATIRYEPLVGGLDGLLNELFRPAFARNGNGASEALPLRVDVREAADGYTVYAEVPGVKKEDIHVTIEGNQVTIGAETRRETEQKDGERVLRSERFYGNLYRSFTLPVELDEGASTAKYENGVLELTLARKQQPAGRKLTIQ